MLNTFYQLEIGFKSEKMQIKSFLSCRRAIDKITIDLDAILGELCALERRCDGDIAATPVSDSQRQGRPGSTRINSGENTEIGKNDGG